MSVAILMTDLTTILAVIPLAVSACPGTIISAEMAVVVIVGLPGFTLLTLFVMPVICAVVHRRQEVPAKK